MNEFWRHIENEAINVGVAVLTYSVLLAAAHPVKKRLRVPLGFSFNIFAVLTATLVAWFVHQARGGTDVNLPWMVSVRDALVSAWAVFLALQINNVLARFVWQFALEEKRRVKVPKLLRDLAKVLLLLTAVLCVMKFVYGQQLGTIITASGIVAVVLGFALQNLLGDVVAGIALNLEKPFDIGDWIWVGETDGEVIEINWRATRLRTRDDNYLIIPNGNITKQNITNFHYPNRVHALKCSVGVEYGAAPNDVKSVLRQAVRHTSGVLPKEPRVRLKQFADSAINYEIKFWVDNRAASDDVLSDVMTNIWYALRRARMSIPFPIRDVFMHQPAEADSVDQRRRADAEHALRAVELLKPLDHDQIVALAGRGRLVRFGHGETVISKGDAGDSLFLIVSGQASVKIIRESGGEVVAGTLKTGDTFGEMSLLTGAPRNATVVAESDLRLLEIGKDALGPVLQENPAVAEALSRLMADRQLATDGFFKQQQHAAEAAETREHYATALLRNIRDFFSI
ncbi:MAG: mechanosensitive ion channel family protein [Verrucomicrobiia bacterium]|jgi:small-conductance mechanosensitive channel/CRP-like cAMP-binding protein